MALIKFGMMMTDASGKLGGQVFSKNKGGNYVRTKVSPSNPNTSFQSGVRSLFGSLSAAWSGLTDEQRDSWNSAVDSFKRTNVFGDLKAPTGKALYQRLNQNLVISGQSQLTVAPIVDSPAAISVSSATATIGSTTFEVQTVGDSTGDKIQVWATPLLSAGTSFVKNRLRAVQYSAGSSAALVDIWASYVARFGAPVAGGNVYIAIRTISPTGQASPLFTFKATISA